MSYSYKLLCSTGEMLSVGQASGPRKIVIRRGAALALGFRTTQIHLNEDESLRASGGSEHRSARSTHCGPACAASQGSGGGLPSHGMPNLGGAPAHLELHHHLSGCSASPSDEGKIGISRNPHDSQAPGDPGGVAV